MSGLAQIAVARMGASVVMIKKKCSTYIDLLVHKLLCDKWDYLADLSR